MEDCDEYWKDIEEQRFHRNVVMTQRKKQLELLNKYRARQQMKRQIRDFGEQAKLRQQSTEAKGHPIKTKCTRPTTFDRLSCSETRDLKLYLERFHASLPSRQSCIRWEELQLANCKALVYDDIPWPPSTTHGFLNSLALLDASDMDPQNLRHFQGNEIHSSEIKAIFRKETLKWHPDKFKMHTGKRIQSTDLERVMKRVTETSQSLNQEYARLKAL